jgi:hypothetical protein
MRLAKSLRVVGTMSARLMSIIASARGVWNAEARKSFLTWLVSRLRMRSPVKGVRTVDRDRQIELMQNVEERTRGYVQRWLSDPEVRAALHRYDRDQNDGDGEPRRVSAR